MTLATSGAISMGGNVSTRSINLELGQSATTQISLNQASVRTLAGVPSGAIIMPTNFYGKSSSYSYSGTMTQGIDNSGLFTGYGFLRNTPTGSISPDDTTIINVFKFNNGSQWFFSITLATPVGTPQSYWTTVTIGGSFSINSSAATSFLNSNTWEFAGTDPAPLTGSGTTSLVFS
jgi:hypothetical protein